MENRRDTDREHMETDGITHGKPTETHGNLMENLWKLMEHRWKPMEHRRNTHGKTDETQTEHPWKNRQKADGIALESVGKPGKTD